MTKEEFWNKVDSIDVDSRADGRYTEEEMYEIGCAFTELTNSEKREIGGWDKICSILKPRDKEGNIVTSGEKLRCWVKTRRYNDKRVMHNVHMLSGTTIEDITFAEFVKKTTEIKEDLYIQQVKTRDERNSYRRTLRDTARIETMVDAIKETVAQLKELPEVEPYYPDENDEGREAVLLFSDLHLGMEIDNFYNKYNIEIARARVNKLVEEVIRVCNKNNVTKLNFMNLGDCIHGLIHVTCRIEEETDVISQVMIAAEILADALNKLQEAAVEVVYRSCTDNHARCVADIHQHIEKENFGRLIDFYLKARLKDTGIVFAEDNLDDDISLIKLNNGKKMIGVHGHRENTNTSVQDFLGATREYVDYIVMGHYHESKMKGFQGAKVFVNGSICGSDQYAQSKRLYGEPEQTLLIFDGDTLGVNYINLK